MQDSNDPNYQVSGKCDVFSLGIIFYILCCGHGPFNSSRPGTIYEQNLACEIDWHNGKISKLEPNIVGMIQKMCNKDPKKRISAEEALESTLFSGSLKISDLQLTTNFVLKNSEK